MKTITPLTKLTLLLLAITTMMSNVAIITALPHLKEYFTNIENIEFLSRLMITLPALAIAILAPFLGHLIYKVGKYKSAVVALFFFSIFGSAGFYLNSLDMILLSRFLLGTCIATLMIVSTSLVGDYFNGDQRHRFMGIQSAFISLGGLIFVVGGGVLSDIDWRYSFFIYLIGFLLIPFVLLFLKDTKPKIETLNDVDFNTSLVPIYILAFILMVLFYTLPTQMPFLMINQFGASSTLTGGIIGLAFISHALGALSFRKLKQKFDFSTVYMIGMAIIAFGFITIGLVSNVYLFFLTSPIMGFGGGILMTNIQAWMLHKAHHTKRIKSSGYLTSSLFLGQFFSPIVFHPIVASLGVQHFFIFSGIVVFSVLAIIIYKRKKI